MASINWPATLPDAPILSGYSEKDQDQQLRTAMDIGPPKVRRRFTAYTTECTINLKLTTALKDTLMNFYNVTTQAGSLPFNWDYFGSSDLRIKGTISRTPITPESWMCSFIIEKLP